jgi:NAD+ kinase
LKAKILLDGGKPKVGPSELREAILKAGLDVGEGDADFGVVVGGDGRFSRYGRTEDIPLLFVGVRSGSATGSKAYLAETTFDRLPGALAQILAGEYQVVEHRRLAVRKNEVSLGEVFTDVYLERGAESTCIRYNVKVEGSTEKFQDAAIGDGVVVSTSAGATGYYSYPDRVKGDVMDPMAFGRIPEESIGVCHIAPTYTERLGSGGHPLRYTVPLEYRVELSLFREADARLYGTADSRAGVKVELDDVVSISPGQHGTKVISLRAAGRQK